MKMKKKYQKPAVSTIEIPERTAFACNLSNGNHACPTGSNMMNMPHPGGGQGHGCAHAMKKN